MSVASAPAPPVGGAPVAPARRRSPRLGYALTAAAAAMWAVNGSLGRLLIDDGVSPFHLAEMRSALSCVALAAWLIVADRTLLRVRRDQVGQLAFFGIAGLALVNGTYFLAIERLDVGVALTIQYLGPLLILVWLRIAHGRRMSPTLWGAGALSVVGAFLVVRAYDPTGLDGVGLVFAVGAAISFAIYMVAAERAGARGHHPLTSLTWGFGFATLVWLVVRPPWTFPFEAFADPRNLALGLGVALVGTLIPFMLIVTAVRHIAAPRAGVVSTLEPVLGALIAWPVLDQALSAPQVVGGLVVVAAVIWVQSHRPQAEAETAPH